MNYLAAFLKCTSYLKTITLLFLKIRLFFLLISVFVLVVLAHQKWGKKFPWKLMLVEIKFKYLVFYFQLMFISFQLTVFLVLVTCNNPDLLKVKLIKLISYKNYLII